MGMPLAEVQKARHRLHVHGVLSRCRIRSVAVACALVPVVGASGTNNPHEILIDGTKELAPRLCGSGRSLPVALNVRQHLWLEPHTLRVALGVTNYRLRRLLPKDA